MMPAAKHGDPQLGIDIHLCVVPMSPPVPLPTPHTSIVFDPFDYLPYIGATVTVCGMKRATAGTAATAIHIPPGFPFAPKIPDTDDEIFMGSSTVVADGEPFSHISLPVLSCQVAGMISPPRVKKKGPPNLMILPTTVNLAIPTSVVVGGPPTISLIGMAFKGLFAGLGKFARSGVFKRMRKALFKNMDPGFLKCTILRAEPVNILTGAVAVEQDDFTLPGRIPLEWIRSYSSSSKRNGLCGYGWETLGDIRLEVNAETGGPLMIHPSKGPLIFERLPVVPGDVEGELELIDGAQLSDHETEFQVRTKEDRIYHFPKKWAQKNGEGITEYLISRISDLCGNAIEFERRGDALSAILDPAGRRLNIQTEFGRITEMAMDILEQETPHVFVRYEYDISGDLVSVIDALGHPYTFAYENHHMTRHTDRNGLSFYYEYKPSVDGEWRVVHAWGDGGLYDYQFDYVDVLNERRITNSLGHVSIVKLNEAGLPISEIDPLGGITSFEYDDRGRTTAVTDQEQYKTEYEYDDRGNLLKLTRPDGSTVESEFNLLNKAINITDPNGALWEQEWDDRGLLIRQQTPLGAESLYEYDTRGQLTRFSSPKRAQTTFTFDGSGNVSRLIDAFGHATYFSYDVLGNVTDKTDALNQRTLYFYDLKSRLTKAIFPSGVTIACAYDHQDNLTRFVNENGAETKMEYFGQAEIARRIQPDGHSVQYHYNTEEQLIAVTNQRGERYQLIRDPMGRIVEEVDYWGQRRRYTYTEAGHLKEGVDPLGRMIYYKTNPLGRIIKKVLPTSLEPEALEAESFEYDANGNLLACENETIRIQRSFDGEGRLLEERQGEVCTITNAYDPNGNRTLRTTQVGIGKSDYTKTVHYQYDALDQAIGVEVEGHDPVQLARNALGQVTTETLSETVRREIAYSEDGFMTSQRVTAQEGPVFEQQFRYDKAGNLVEKHDSALGTDQYTYDPLGRLVSHLNPEKRLTRYVNDPAGDRLRTRINQPTEEDEPSPSDWRREGEHEGIYYRFDRAGNLTEWYGAEGGTQFCWDVNQRLITSITKGKTTVYHYDSLGRRVSKETDGVVTHFFWDGDALLGDLLVEGDNNKPVAQDETKAVPSSRLREWVYYPSTFEPLAMLQDQGESGSEFYLYHNDPNGCPTRLLDIAGDVVWAARYNAWGKVEKLLVDRVDNPIRLQGQYEDIETTFYYNRFRFYDPISGMFVTQDPLRLWAGENLYSYAPDIKKWADPLGLSCRSVAAANLRDLGLEGVDLAKSSFNRGRRQLKEAGFELVETTPTGRKVFRNPRNGAEVYYDSGGALVGKQKPHWHIRDAGGQAYDRSGRAVDRGAGSGHIPAG